MKTINWQTKALTLFMAAVVMIALGLVVACETDSPGPTEHVWSPTYKRIMPLGPCPDDINSEAAIQERTVEERFWYAQEKMKKYNLMVLAAGVRATGASVVQLKNQFGNWDFIHYPDYGEVTFIEITVNTSDVDVNSLPDVGENPLCFEGVPVHFVTDQPYGTFE